MPARAQNSTTGAIEGIVRDSSAGTPLAGVTVVATSTSLQGSQSEITGTDGRYRLGNLPPGSYLVRFYFGDTAIERKGVEVPLGQSVTINQALDPTAGEVIEVQGSGSGIDATSTNQGARLTQDYMRNIPLPGRTFGSALGAAAGSQGDSRGVAFSGSTSLENQYVVDGVNTTGLTFGTIGTPLINEFIEEIQVITGGYQAEYGRATGAVVNVVTKQGSNEFHGSAFVTLTPYQVNREPVRTVNTSIDRTTDLDFLADFGVDAGGPLIKDKLWFYVGFAPQLLQNNITRTVQRQVDCHQVMPDGRLSVCDPGQFQDGSPDEDPETGDLIFEPVESSEFKTNAQAYQFVSKLNVALSPEHQGQASLVGTPTTGEGVFGHRGAPIATRADFTGLTTDVALKWTSKFNDNRSEIELLAGWHRDKYDQDSLEESANGIPTTRVFLSNLGRFGAAGGENPAALAGCTDSAAAGDPYPLIENCPVFEYALDSPGFTIDNLEDRKSGLVKLTQRIESVGSHLVKVGLDVEDNKTVDVRHFTGGRYYQLIPDPGFLQVRVYRFVNPEPSGATDVCGFDGFGEPRPCSFLDRATVTGETLNWGYFAQDSWQILPNLTLNAGMRYEEQRLRYARQIRDTVDPFTMEPVGNNAIKLDGLWAPRFGLLYDFTKEGRSKVYTSFGRFYESIPMALNDFSFSGTTLYGAFFGFDQCQGNSERADSAGTAPSPNDCPRELTENPSGGDTYRGGTTLVTPGTKAQYMDEVILGAEYEVLEDLRVGVAYKDRRIGRVLEDVSIDNAETYIIGNPGVFDEGRERELQDEIDALAEDDPERQRLEARLEGFRALERFEKPRRDYSALELTAIKRFSRNLFIQGSYTYARTRGNYPGLLNEDTGSALPNISTQYDLAELLANRDGPLPQDRPHYFKLDGYYTFDFEELGKLTAGVRFRALSGTPIDALGSHNLYGFGESYVLPRGSQGRTELVSSTDLHVGYARRFGDGYQLSTFVDVINAFNQEQTFAVDELYTFDNVNPIVGGDRGDLIFAKQLDVNGNETATPIGRNIAYGTPLARYAPLYFRVGARLSF